MMGNALESNYLYSDYFDSNIRLIFLSLPYPLPKIKLHIHCTRFVSGNFFVCYSCSCGIVSLNMYRIFNYINSINIVRMTATSY